MIRFDDIEAQGTSGALPGVSNQYLIARNSCLLILKTFFISFFFYLEIFDTKDSEIK